VIFVIPEGSKPMTRSRQILLAAGIAVLAPASSFAHHGWGSYDAANPVTLTGEITRLEFANPHVHIDLATPGKTWEVTLAPPFRMDNRGAVAALMPVGKKVTAFGYASRVKGAELRAEWIEIDGKRIELR
jgi:hypothetical protein